MNPPLKYYCPNNIKRRFNFYVRQLRKATEANQSR